MSDSLTVKLTSDEVEMLIDALEVDLEGYAEAVNNSHGADKITFTEAAQRIQALTAKLQALID